MADTIQPLLQKFSSAISDVLSAVKWQAAEKDTETHKDQCRQMENESSSFKGYIDSVRTQLKDKRELPIPNLRSGEPESVIHQNVERAIISWNQIFGQLLESQKVQPSETGDLLSDIQFWQTKRAVLGNVVEQLNSEKAKAVIRYYQQADGQFYADFANYKGTLEREFKEAEEISKFMGTLERHFNTIEKGQFNEIETNYEALMNILRMLWLISVSFSSVERMGALFVKISNRLCERAKERIPVETVLQLPHKEAVQTVEESQRLLKRFEDAYYEERRKIEEAGEIRWEFHHRFNFLEQIDHIIGVCKGLNAMMKKMNTYEQILGNELKNISSFEKDVDNARRGVSDMREPLLHLKFDLFQSSNKGQWGKVVQAFEEDASETERNTAALIESSFKSIRSVEGAFDYIRRFSGKDTPAAIQAVFDEQLSRILDKVDEEVRSTRTTFETRKDRPPQLHSVPPVAGAIHWAAFLYERVKKPVVKFKLKEFTEQWRGREAYIQLCRDLKNYRRDKAAAWQKNVTEKMLSFLNVNVLSLNGNVYPPELSVNFNPMFLTMVREAKQMDRIGQPIPEVALDVAVQEDKFRKQVEELTGLVNAYQSAVDSIRGIEKDMLAMKVRQLLTVIMPGITTYNWNTLSLNEYIQDCMNEISRFQSVVSHTHDNEDQIQASIDRVSNSKLVTLPEFPKSKVDVSGQHYLKLDKRNNSNISGKQSQAQRERDKRSQQQQGSQKDKKKQTAEDIVAEAMGYKQLFGVPDLTNFVRQLESYRERTVTDLAHAYTNSARMKNHEIEANVFNQVATGKHPMMVNFYLYWEVNMLTALRQMVQSNMILACRMFGEATQTAQGPRKRLLFQTEPQLVGGTIVEQPTHTEIERQIRTFCVALCESPQKFIRWVRGTCEECPKQPTWSFYQETKNTQDELVQVPMRIIGRTLSKLQRHMTTWKRDEKLISGTTADRLKQIQQYEMQCQQALNTIAQTTSTMPSAAAVAAGEAGEDGQVSGVDQEKEQADNKEQQQSSSNQPQSSQKKRRLGQMNDLMQMPVRYYTQQFSMYHRLIQAIAERPDEAIVDFVGINFARLKEQLIDRAKEIIWEIGKALYNSAYTRPRVTALNEVISNYREQINTKPNTLDELKHVLSIMEEIRMVGMEKELEYNSICSRFELLHTYGLDKKFTQKDKESGKEIETAPIIGEDEYEEAMSLPERWSQLLAEAKAMDVSMETTKETFAKDTEKDVSGFRVELEEFVKKFQAAVREFTKEGADMDFGADQVQEYHEKLNEFKRQREQLLEAERMFDLPMSQYPAIKEMELQLAGFSRIYDLHIEVKKSIEQWSSIRWEDLHIEELTSGVDAFRIRLKRIGKDKELAKLPPYAAVTQTVDNFGTSLQLIACFKNPSLQQRHWEELMDRTKQKFDLHDMTLRNLLGMQLYNFEKEIQDIAGCADREMGIERELDAIADVWRSLRFEVVKHTLQSQPTTDRGYVVKGIDAIEEKLEDHVQSLQAMQASRYYRPHREKGGIWEKNLGCISAVTTQWIAVQKKWLYLENIFIGSEDIRTRMPDQAKDFDNLDRDFRKIMLDTYRAPNVLEACSVVGREAQLLGLMAMLEKCQKSLSEYLEGKRVIFPRFFFISEDDLLSILGSSDPQAVQRHLSNLFDNCAKLIFGTGMRSKAISGMVSEEGENLPFRAECQAEGSVEVWMTTVEAEMRRTLRARIKETIYYYASMHRTTWIEKFLGMGTICGSQVWWTWGVEDTFRNVRGGDKHALKNYCALLGVQIKDLVATMRGGSSLDAALRMKVKNMIILDVHARDIVSDFIRDSVLDAREFDWEKQLRFYFDKERDGVIIKQCTGTFDYGYEYIGLRDRLIITPLTDRCYMTLTQALSMRYGGAPAGPAGTGKTETVKDLAKGLALLCIVFNCSDGLNAAFMASLFTGLCEIGAWGCFDEFNRIDPDVMSVISNQILRIQIALRSNASNFKLDGTHEVSLDNKVGIFITMNPGYAGRSELPDNLKALFRSCVMVVPDKEQICEILLFSEGFDTAKTLAKKMTVLYTRAEGQLSKQTHYDFGLRALKSVLSMAGSLKRGSPDSREDVVLMRALRDMNLPKFVYEDVPLFMGLIKDLYPDLELPKQVYPELNEAVESVLKKNNYVVTETQVLKVVQLYDTMFTRHTTMVVGPSGGGKTVVITTLQEAQTKLGYPTKLFVLNPKSITNNDLYGVSDPTTNDWQDGLLSNIFRNINTTPMEKRERRYIVYDGDVDAHWVENMNSVMDDNRLLTLPNRERIVLRKECAMLFEVGNLKYASPATVSRCGMVYVDPHDLPPRTIFMRWLASRPKEEQESLRTWHDRYIPRCFEYIFDGTIDGVPVQPPEEVPEVEKPKKEEVDQYTAMAFGDEEEGQPAKKEEIMPSTQKGVGEDGRLLQAIPQTAVSVEVQLCNIYQALVPTEGIDYSKFEEPIRHMLFIFAACWACGGSMLEGSRVLFDEFYKHVVDLSVITASDHDAGPNQLPGQLRTLFDFYFDVDKRCWKAWENKVTEYQPPVDRLFCNILVPTTDTVRHSSMLQMLMEQKVPVLFIGESGTAKTVTIQSYMRGRDPETMTTLTINFSNRTNSLQVQRTLDDNLDRPLMGVIRPRAGKKLIVFIDDLNMPQMDKEETQQPIALLKFLFDRGGLYGRSSSDLSFRKYQDLQFVAAMGPPGGGRNPTDIRFSSKFSVFNLPFPTMSSLRRIYESILLHHFEPFDQSIQKSVTKIVEATLYLYSHVTSSLPATPNKFHYIFNLRDLSRVTEGLTLSVPNKFQSIGSIVRLWSHEVLRVFQDRLVDSKDRDLVKNKMRELATEYWPQEAENAYAEPLLFGSYKKANLSVGDLLPGEEKEVGDDQAKEDPKEYEDLENYDTIKPIVEECLESYNETRLRMNLVMFADALGHLARIHRIIRMCRGNALLIGYGGSGKQSLTKLATFIAGYTLFQITLSRGYGDEAFRQDLKKLYNLLGTMNKEVVFLFTDQHVVDASFLEYINSMLTSGMVPALYAEDEKDNIVRELSEEMTRFGFFSRDQMWSHFVNKCRNNLHIVLCMSPAGDTLRIRCRNFPGLVSNSCIDWFDSWSEDALISVANVFLAEIDLPDEHRDGIVSHMVRVHSSMQHFNDEFYLKLRRHNYVTPKNYLDYISNYKKLLRDNREKFAEQAQHLKEGVDKLISASTEVDTMNEKLREQKKVTDEQARQCDDLVKQIEMRTQDVKKKSDDVEKRKKDLWVEQERIVVDKQDAENELALAAPALEAAAQALRFLEDNKDSINEMRAYNTPPKVVQQVCECVAILLEEKDLTWDTARTMLRQAGFLDLLVNYNKEKLLKKESIMARVIPRLQGQNPAEIKQKHSKAAGFIMEWVVAMYQWYDKAKFVQPKKERVEAAEAKLRQSMADLEKAENEIVALNNELKLLDEALQQKRKEQAELKAQLTIMERQLNNARRLIAALSTEKVRWAKQLKELGEKRVLLIGDCLLTAAFLSYSGAFSQDFRKEMIYQQWHDDILERRIPLSQPYRVEQLLTDEVEISQWANESLPGDELSVQNGILTTRASRFPLCIDPQEQAVKWIRIRESANELIRTSFNSDFLPQLRRAIMFGRPILFENVEEYIDPILDPVLEKNILRAAATGGAAAAAGDDVKGGGRRFIVLGDQEVDWNPEFRMYMTTKMSNPHYTPEISGKTMIVNFKVTPKGLEDQLLNAVVGIEREDLEKGHQELIQTMSELKNSLKETEETLLREFTAVKGSLLDNEELIALLEKTKGIFLEVTDKLERAKDNEKQIDEARSRYRAAATRGSILFFVMSSLSSILPMCEYSLDSFKDIFVASIKQAQRSDDLYKRLKNIIEVVTDNVFNYVCLGLFESYRLMFSFQMTLKIMEPQGLINEFQLQMFLKGSLALEKSQKQRPEDSEDWLSETGWEDAIELAQGDPGRFGNLLEELDKNQEQWREWALSEKPEEELPPFLPSAAPGYEEGRKSSQSVQRQDKDNVSIKNDKTDRSDKQKEKQEKEQGEQQQQIEGQQGSEQEQKKEGESGDQEQEQKKESGEGEEGEEDEDKEKKEQEEEEEITGTEVNQVQMADPGRIGGDIDPTQLTELERLCLLRIVRMDRIAAGVTHFVVSLMGIKYVKFPILLYDDVYMRSTALSPVVFIISPGADPATDVIALGERRGFTQPMRLRNISLGQNMEPLAELAIDQAVTRGQWVLLQNCHLLPNWLKNLEKKLEAIAEKSADQLDPEFRLYLTSEPTETFPMGILQRSLKVVTEPPNSLKMNMLTTYGRLGQDELAKSLHPAYRPMAYVLAFFHAVVQERRKYGKLGWNVPYDFNESDFRVSLDLIATYLNKSIEAQEGLGGPSSVRPNVAVQKSIDAEKAAGQGDGQQQQDGQTEGEQVTKEEEDEDEEQQSEEEEEILLAGFAEIQPDYMGEETEEEKEARQKKLDDAKLKRKQERQARRQAAIDAGETGSIKSTGTGSTTEIGGVAPMSSTTAPIPWPSLRYLVGEVMYGGRVTDDWDRRVLMTYQDEYMGDFLFDTFQQFHFFKNDRVDYVIPHESLEPTPVGVVDYIENRIPASAPPEVFGLHQNAEISFNTNAAKAMWKNLIDLQPRGGAAPVAEAGAGDEKTSSEDRLQIVANDVQSRIPPKNIDINVVRTQFGVPTPTQVVLMQELEHWNRLCDKMRLTLKDLHRALQGEIGMSAELDDLSSSLSSGFIPEVWRQLAPRTLKSLAGWMDHFRERSKQYITWVEDGEPKVMWLSGLHLPEAYINAIVQEACRKKKWPLDRSAIYTRVTDQENPEMVREKPKLGCLVKGMFLEGASWDMEEMCLAPQNPKVLVSELPILEIVPIEASQKRLQNSFTCPVYVTQERCNKMGFGFVFEANLNTTAHISHWILQGVALSLNDS